MPSASKKNGLNRPPSMMELADELDLSVATVSNALRGCGAMTAATRQRVVAAAAKRHYRPSLLAQQLKQRSTRTIGMLVPMIGDTAYAPMLQAVERVARSNGYNVILGDTELSADLEREYTEMMMQRRVEGVIMIPYAPRPAAGEGHLLELEKAGVPLVLLDQDLPLPGIARVVADNQGAIRTAVRHLAGLGHRRIGFLYMAPVAWDFASRARLNGFRAAVAELGLTPEAAPELAVGEVAIGDEAAHNEHITQLVAQLMARPDRPTAIVVPTDMLAIKIMRCLWLAGLKVPDDLAVVGFDDILVAAHTTPSLTTMRQPAAAMGARAAERLFARIRGEAVTAATCEILPCELVVRESCGAGTPASLRHSDHFPKAAEPFGSNCPTPTVAERRAVTPRS
jgi:DNA-binding LacI/PurR family transcriptional regulator